MSSARRRTVPPDVRAVFVQGIAQISTDPVTLPDPLRAPTSLRFVWDFGRGRNHILCLRTEHVGGRYVLDFYSSRNDGETSYHGRIHEDGRRESLENYEGQVSMPVLATPELTAREHERIWAWNEEVARVLRSKGFL